VVLLGRSRFFTEARWMGVARGLNAAAAGGTAPEPVREKVGR
jgi:hypothetical protein